jgi:hypothetical protein
MSTPYVAGESVVVRESKCVAGGRRGGGGRDVRRPI